MWLTQGDGIGGTMIPNTWDVNDDGKSVYNGVGGRCVATCATFPEKSCILPHDDAKMCPKTTTWTDGTDYNVGTCDRRCGMTGTGRSSRINQGMEAHIAQSADATDCCKATPNDYCCAWDGTLAVHCSLGRLNNNSPLCGVPISGTPNNFFNTPPGTIPPSMAAVAAQQLPPPGFGYPGFAPGFGYPGMGPVPMMGMYNAPMFFRNYGENTNMSEEEALKAVQAENDRMFFYPAAGPQFYRPLPPPPRPTPPPPAVDQQPTAFICSCDDDCIKDENADCCTDYYKFCGFGNQEAIGLADEATYYPTWWIYDKPLTRSNRG
jgi:hypothetical protein